MQKSSIVAALAVFLTAVLAAPGARAATPPSSAAASASAWAPVAASALRAPMPARPLVDPDRFAAFTLDQDALQDVLAAAPAERRRTAAPAPGEGLVVSVPAPDGGLQRFAVVDSPILAPALAAARPDLKTYAGRGVDDPTATIRLDTTPIGFHASVRSDAGDWYVDPRYADLSQYVAYPRGALAEDPASAFAPGEDVVGDAPTARTEPDLARVGETNGGAVTLRTYRLALVSDNTYTSNSGSGGDTTAAKTVLMNRVNQVYEADLAIRMVLIAQTPSLNLDTAAKYSGTNGPCGPTSCFTAGDGCSSAVITRNNVVAGLLAGAGNYDVAHLVLGIDGGGIAGLGVVGSASKGKGCTGLPTPIGDYFAIDYVAHELGHQFGANHTFASTTGSCGGGNVNAATAVEPGSGSSIMAYAGICGADNLQSHSDPYFSQRSLTEISTYVTGSEGTNNDQQQAVLTGFDGTDAFRLTYNGQQSALITRGTNYTATDLQTAIQAMTGVGTASVSAVSDSGFTVTFGGTLSGQAVSALGFTALSGATGYISETIAGGATRRRGTPSATGNHNPNVSVASSTYTIPARTPFLLDAAATDAESDPLTYLWEQNDAATGSLVSNAKSSGPLFRVFGTAAVVNSPYTSPAAGENLATATSWRSFPDLAQIASGHTNAATGTCSTSDVECLSEFLPTASYAGPMHFRVSVRDNHSGGGGVGTADVTVNVATGAGPFRVTSQAAPATVASGGQLPVTWDVAGTTANGINAANVKISLSTDGGLTFPTVLAASTPNDGSEAVTLPAVTTSTARLKVEAVGNAFFDVSHANLTIATSVPVAITAPASADLGAATVGAPGPDTPVTFTNGGTGTATVGAASIAGADAGAIAKVADSCSSTTLASGASCTVTLRLTPGHTGTQSAALRLPSDDGASPRTVGLTGTGMAAPAPPATSTPDSGLRPSAPATTTATPPAPAPKASPAPSAAQLAAALLGVEAPYAVGSAGTLKVYAMSKSTKLGRPKATKAIAAAVCTGGTCRGKATARLTITPRRGKAKGATITVAKVLTLRSGQAVKLSLKLTAAQRRAIKAARRAKLVLTVTNGSAKVTRSFSLTVG